MKNTYQTMNMKYKIFKCFKLSYRFPTTLISNTDNNRELCLALKEKYEH